MRRRPKTSITPTKSATLTSVMPMMPMPMSRLNIRLIVADKGSIVPCSLPMLAAAGMRTSAGAPW